MIVVDVSLHSAIDGRIENLGTMIIANDGTAAGGLGNYDVAMYRKGAAEKYQSGARALPYHAKPTRRGRVEGHRRLAEPVHNLVAKALASMGYGQ